MLHLSPTKVSPETLRNSLLTAALTAIFVATGCSSTDTADIAASTDDTTTTDDTMSEVSDAEFEATDWTEATHGKSADPNFDEVFEDTQVKRLDFVVTEERWQSMLDDMTAIYGEFRGD